jgi:hypothetical protein
MKTKLLGTTSEGAQMLDSADFKAAMFKQLNENQLENT